MTPATGLRSALLHHDLIFTRAQPHRPCFQIRSQLRIPGFRASTYLFQGTQLNPQHLPCSLSNAPFPITLLLRNILAYGRNSDYFSWVLIPFPSLAKPTFSVFLPITHAREHYALPKLIYLLSPEHCTCICSICVFAHDIPHCCLELTTTILLFPHLPTPILAPATLQGLSQSHALGSLSLEFWGLHPLGDPSLWIFWTI